MQAAWVTSPSGLAFTIGGPAAISSFIDGLVLVGPSVADRGPERAGRRLERADRLMRVATRIDLPLILMAGFMMAVGRYL